MNNLKIQRENLDRKGNIIGAIMFGALSVIAISMAIIEWQSGIPSVIFVALFFVLNKLFFEKFILNIITTLALIVLTSFIFDFSTMMCIANCLLLSCAYFFVWIIKKLRIKTTDDIFEINSHFIKCLSTKSSDYKGYVLNPSAYLKTFPLKQVKSVTIKKKFLQFTFENETITPRELTHQEVLSIYEFVRNKFPKLTA